MKNELRIKPLMKYEVTTGFSIDPEVFTADTHIVDEGNIVFYRTGNIIRQYVDVGGIKIVITPVDDDEEAKVQE